MGDVPGQTGSDRFALNVSLPLGLCVQDAPLDELLSIGSHGQLEGQAVLAGYPGAQSRCDRFPCQVMMLRLSETTC